MTREIFPTTHLTWLATQIDADPISARDHVMARYFEPLCAYARASTLRQIGEPSDLVNDFFAARLCDASYLTRWSASGLSLRRWLANGLLTHARNRAMSEARRRSVQAIVDPNTLEATAPSHETNALLALERAWAMRVMIEAHDRVHSELQAEGKSAWWDLFRFHSVQGLSYAVASKATGVPLTSASNVNRVVATRLREALTNLLERDGVARAEIEHELGLMQDLLGG